MKKEERTRLLKVGVFLAATLLITLILVFILGRTRSLFSDKIHVHTYFDHVNGLIVGSPVRLSGFEIGIVENIRFTSELSKDEALCASLTQPEKQPNPIGKKPKVYIEMNIQKEFLQYIRKDSVAQLSSKGLLGDAVVDIVAGDMQGEQVQNGACLPSERPTTLSEVTELAQKTIKDASELLVDARRLVSQTSGLVQHVDHKLNIFLSEEMAKDVHRSLHSIADVVEGAEHGPGLVHALLYDKQLPSDLKRMLAGGRKALLSLQGAMVRLHRIVRRIETGPGAANALIYQDSISPLLKDLTHAVKQVDDVLTEVKGGSGVLHSLVYEKDQENIVQHLNQTVVLVQKMVKEIDEGKGTLGGLVKDPSVYKTLKRIVKNAQGTIEDSKVLTWILQRLNKDSRPESCRVDDE